jgi:hypothetical protein
LEKLSRKGKTQNVWDKEGRETGRITNTRRSRARKQNKNSFAGTAGCQI